MSDIEIITPFVDLRAMNDEQRAAFYRLIRGDSAAQPLGAAPVGIPGKLARWFSTHTTISTSEAAALYKNGRSASASLVRLSRQGRLRRLSYGVYALPVTP